MRLLIEPLHGLTRATELVRALEKLTAQHTDTLTRAITELRAAGDIDQPRPRCTPPAPAPTSH